VKPEATGARIPLEEARAALAALIPATGGSFAKTEHLFLEAMWKFDQSVAAGIASKGDIQNGKGDFFNDFLGELLRVCSGKQVHTRPDVPGLLFRKHKLDIAYPLTGQVRLMVETKMTGLPKHPGSERQKHPEGRAGHADLDKRIKESAFKNIDIKGEVARNTGEGGGATSDLTTWLRNTEPKSYLFFACRMRDAHDLVRTQAFAQTAASWFDGVGLFCYGKNTAGTAYEKREVHTGVDLDRQLSILCTALRALP
jgi:hypothetical protein